MESSGKSNPRIIGGAQRARNKTILMGADQLESLRGESEVASGIEEVGDLLGAIEPTVVQESVSAMDLDEGLFDELPQDELDVSTVEPEIMAEDSVAEPMVDDASALALSDEFNDVFDSEITPIIEGDTRQPGSSGEREESLGEDAGSMEGDVAEERVPQIARLVRVGSPTGPMDGSSIDVDVAQGQKGALDLRHDPDEVKSSNPRRDLEALSRHRRQKRACKDALVGFLVSFDDDPRGVFVELREGRMMVTSESVGTAPCLLLAHPSVCPMHAIMKLVSGEPIHILDQLSQFGTRVIDSESGQERRLSGEKGIARHGDIVYFGERKFHVCLVSVEMDNNE